MKRSIICGGCSGYGRCPTYDLDPVDGTDRGYHCEDCDGRGLVELDACEAAADEAASGERWSTAAVAAGGAS